MTRRQNPKLGKYPDLYAARVAGPQRKWHDPERLHGPRRADGDFSIALTRCSTGPV